MDEATMDDRVDRWKGIANASFDSLPDNLAWFYLTEMDEMYINGHFVGVVLLCAAMAEMILIDQLKSKLKIPRKQTERSGLDRLITLGMKQGVVSESEFTQLNELKRLRNNLIHAKADELGKMAKPYIQDEDQWNSAFYLLPLKERGIQADAQRHLELVRILAVRFYGTQDT